MKRFLSILLIAAGLLALYGDYVNITDIFACKTYWEETSSKSEDDLNALGAGLTKLKKNRKAYEKAKKQLAKGKKSLAAAEARYAATGAKVNKAKKGVNEAKSVYTKLTDLIKAISSVRTEYTKQWKAVYDKMNKERKAIVTAIKGPDPNDESRTVRKLLYYDVAALITDKDQKNEFKTAVKNLSNDGQTAAGYKTFASYCTTISGTIDGFYKTYQELLAAANAILKYKDDMSKLITALNDSPEMYEAAVLMLKYDGTSEEDARVIVDSAKGGNTSDAEWIRDCADYYKPEVAGYANNFKWLKYYVTDSMKTCADYINKNADKLTTEQDKIAKQISTITNTVYKNSSYRKVIQKKMGKDAVKFLETYRKKPNPLNSSQANFASFETQMDTNPGINALLQKAQKLLTTTRTEVKKEYTKANSYYKAYLKTYKAYPAKLEAAQKKLDKLEETIAQYEEGEKASKKGLKALVNEKPDGDLESIKDRVGGNENFNDSKGNLDIDKGMEAVDAGEAYLNDAGDMIRNELTGRAIGAAASVAAAILALLAALLSLFRSNRGGAMLACISAMVAAAGVAMGKTAGDVFSLLAGSKVGELPWTSAMILAGVAMIFAIVHFSAKIEEPLDK